ncbi:MAG: sialate O-acetylesterase [Bacteroidales bacterium]|nr:sialate O-acetylesterase [Bacteroidales bacterium]
MKTGIRTLLLAASILVISSCGGACGNQDNLRVSSIISDNMVLQQQTEVNIWGWAKEGTKVVIDCSWLDSKVRVSADRDGRWIARVRTPEAGWEPQEIKIGTPTKLNRITVGNILVGDVWLAGGQSNMEMPLKGFDGCCVKGGTDEAFHAHNYPGIRYFYTPKVQKTEVQEECDGRWTTTESFSDVLEWSATAWYFARELSDALHIPIGIICCNYGGSAVESWMPREILEQYPDIDLTEEGLAKQIDYTRPLLMYNAMLQPVHNYTLKGYIFYQGCTNVGRPDYAKRLATMVSHWREIWGQGDIPFYYVQIAPYQYDGSGQTEMAPYLREQQDKARSLIPNSAMVSTIDLVPEYERHNIHPADKKTVGQRLAWVALNKTYGFSSLCCEGPEFDHAEFRGSEVSIFLKNIHAGICRNYDIKGFEIAGADRKFYPADVVFTWQNNSLRLTSPKVPKPVAARFAFRDFPEEVAFYGGNWLPLLPFRTDNW